MPTELNVSLTLDGTSTIKGVIQARPFSRTLKNLAQFQELEVTILPGDVDKVIPLPGGITAGAILLVRTDLPCSFKKNSETAVHSLDAEGEYLEVGSLGALTQLLFTGSGSPKASVYIAVGGN